VESGSGMSRLPYKSAQKNAPRFRKMRQGVFYYGLKENTAKNRLASAGFILRIFLHKSFDIGHIRISPAMF
jgi:hypothetical protein